jgi:hypothetical protein
MTEEQVVEWSILIGNDYTGAFPRSLYRYDGLPEGHTMQALDDLRRFIVDPKRGEGFLLRSSTAPLQRAIEFSRASCALHDLTMFRGEGEDDFDKTEIGRLTDSGRAALRPFLACATNRTSVVHSVMAYLRSSECTVEVRPAQLAAVRRMLAALQDPDHTDRAGREGRVISADQRLPLWEDVYFSLVYQLICREALAACESNARDRALARGVRDAGHVRSAEEVRDLQPQRLFDGALFHSAVAEARREAKAAASGTVAARATSASASASVGVTASASASASVSTSASAGASTSARANARASASAGAGASASASATAARSGAAVHDRLPIDDHRDLILHTIGKNRVTVIEGETGW